ncbi:hypothetical protein Esti_003946 [Eimeria stiedai]
MDNYSSLPPSSFGLNSGGLFSSLSAPNARSGVSHNTVGGGAPLGEGIGTSLPAAAGGLSTQEGAPSSLGYGMPAYTVGGRDSSGAAVVLPSAGLSSPDTPLHAAADAAAAADGAGKAGASVSGSGFYAGSTKYFNNSSSKSASGALMSLPVGSLSSPPLPLSTAEALEKGAPSFCSHEEFEIMVGDLRRTFISWLRNTESELKRERADLVRQRREFEEEKRKVWALFQQDKQNEYNKIKEERRSLQLQMQQQLKQIQVEREDSRAKVQVERHKFEEEKEAYRRQTVLERERFRQEVVAFESERQRVVDSNIATETVLDLNVGGVVFESARNTLTQQKGSFLEALLSGRHRVGRDRQGRVFLDRDAELFRIILNFLRQPNAPPQPRDGAESDALALEAAFLGLHFYPNPLVFAIGGHDGKEHLHCVELLDFERQQFRPCSPLSTERAYAACSAFQNRIFVYGGQNLDYKALCDAEVYDILRDTWVSFSPLNVPRRNACGAALGNRHFVVGGFDGERILSSVECMDTRIKGWRAAAPLLSPRSSAMCCAHGESLVVLGGTKGERLRTAEVYEQRMDRWEPLTAPMIEVRSAGAAVSADSHLYVLGGMDANHKLHASVEALDPEGKQWRFLSPMEQPRMDCAAVCVADSILVVGGQDGDVMSSSCFFDPLRNEWKEGPSLLTPRYGHGLVVSPL